LLENLSKSAHAFAFYLQGPLTKDVCLSQCEPYFDALACGDLSAQQTIRTRAPSAWNKDYEYEDDFLYLRFVLYASESPQPDKIGEDILKRFEAVLDGQSDARFDLCKALHERDADAFNPHLFQWLKKQSADNDGLIEADNIDPDHAVTTARLSVEGLAWLKLAEQRGLPVHDEYPLIPSLARVSITLPAADAWKQIESYFDLPKG